MPGGPMHPRSKFRLVVEKLDKSIVITDVTEFDENKNPSIEYKESWVQLSPSGPIFTKMTEIQK